MYLERILSVSFIADLLTLTSYGPTETVHLPLSCRVHLSLQGFEWFIYNRTASYENILSQMADGIPPTPVPTPVAQSVGMDARGALRKIFSKTSTMTGRACHCSIRGQFELKGSLQADMDPPSL